MTGALSAEASSLSRMSAVIIGVSACVCLSVCACGLWHFQMWTPDVHNSLLELELSGNR